MLVLAAARSEHPCGRGQRHGGHADNQWWLQRPGRAEGQAEASQVLPRPVITMTRRSTAVMVCGLGLVACRPGANSAAQATSSPQESRFVANCEPCLFRIGPNLPPYAFRFHLRVDATGRRAVDSVLVSTAAEEPPSRRLAVRALAPIVPAHSCL